MSGELKFGSTSEKFKATLTLVKGNETTTYEFDKLNFYSVDATKGDDIVIKLSRRT